MKISRNVLQEKAEGMFLGQIDYSKQVTKALSDSNDSMNIHELAKATGIHTRLLYSTLYKMAHTGDVSKGKVKEEITYSLNFKANASNRR